MPRRSYLNHALLLELVGAGHTNQQVADALGCTVRTISRHRAADPGLTTAIIAARKQLAEENRPKCGTARRYAIGCRCRACTDANTLRCREDASRRRERLGLPAANPSRGRPRAVAAAGCHRKVDPGAFASRSTLIAQGIARGEPTSMIMLHLRCDYADVQAVRDSIAAAVAS